MGWECCGWCAQRGQGVVRRARMWEPTGAATQQPEGPSTPLEPPHTSPTHTKVGLAAAPAALLS